MIYIISFSSTTDAMMASSLLTRAKIAFYTIALPGAIKAGCGMALRLQIDKDQLDAMLEPLKQSTLTYEVYKQIGSDDYECVVGQQ